MGSSMYEGKVNVADARVVLVDGVPKVLARNIGLVHESSPGSFDVPCLAVGLTNNLIEKQEEFVRSITGKAEPKRLFFHSCSLISFPVNRLSHALTEIFCQW